MAGVHLALPGETAGDHLASPGEMAGVRLALPGETAGDHLALPRETASVCFALPGETAGDHLALPGETASMWRQPRAALWENSPPAHAHRHAHILMFFHVDDFYSYSLPSEFWFLLDSGTSIPFFNCVF